MLCFYFEERSWDVTRWTSTKCHKLLQWCEKHSAVMSFPMKPMPKASDARNRMHSLILWNVKGRAFLCTQAFFEASIETTYSVWCAMWWHSLYIDKCHRSLLPKSSVLRFIRTTATAKEKEKSKLQMNFVMTNADVVNYYNQWNKT